MDIFGSSKKQNSGPEVGFTQNREPVQQQVTLLDHLKIERDRLRSQITGLEAQWVKANEAISWMELHPQLEWIAEYVVRVRSGMAAQGGYVGTGHRP